MSQTIDQKVVEMKFDNKQFESNIKTSMSSIDKLKQSLNFTGVSKGLDTVSSAAKNCDVSALGRAAETVQAKFGALEVMAVTALANITNSAINAGKRIVSALTIQFPKAGLAEYELQINSTQTIMANTGRTVQDVNAALDELNEYADLTIYNFSEMTKNAGMFTSAGLGLEDTMIALKGVGNWAAFAGANSQQMGNATYQLGQALNAGAVRLQDWMSIEKSAGMAGKKYKEAFVETAQQMGKLNKNFDMSEFRETLKKGWLTTEVFLETMKKFANDPSMTDAATKVKTFTQLIDTLKEALGTGWASSWRLIIGDFEEAKDVFTSISDALSTIINEASETRNAILLGGFGSKWKQLTAKITEAGVSTNAWDEQLSKVLEKHGFDIDALIEQYGSLGAAFSKGVAPTEYLQEAVDGLYNSLADLSGITKDLSKGDKGDNVAEAQKALKTLGYNLGEFGKEADGVDGIFGKMTKSAVEAFQISNELEVTGIIDEKTLNALKEASDSSRLILGNLGELVSIISESGGRENLIAALQNSFKALTDVIKNVKKAWNDVFHPGASEEDIIKEKANMILRITEAIRNFSERLKINDDVAEKLQKTFKGLFSILSIVKSIIGAGINVVMGLLSKLTGQVNIDILGFTASIGDSIVKFKEWLDENDVIAKMFEKIIGWISKAIDKIKEWIEIFKNLPIVKEAVSNLSTMFEDFKQVGLDAISGLKNGLKNGITDIPKLLTEIGTKILEAIKNILGIRSPSTEMYEVGEFTIDGLFNGIKDAISKINWGKLFAGVLSLGIVGIVKKLADTISAFTAPMEGVGAVLMSVKNITDKADKPIKKILNNLAKIEKSFSKVLNSVAFKISVEAITNIVKSLVLLIGAIIVLSFIPEEKLNAAIGVVMTLASIIAAFALIAILISKSSPEFAKGALDMAAFGSLIKSIGIAVLLIASAIKIIGKLNTEQADRGFNGLVVCISAIGVVLLAYGFLVNKNPLDAVAVEQFGKTLLKIAASMLILAVVVRLLGNMSWDELEKAGAGIGGFTVCITALIGITKLIGGRNADKIGSCILMISGAMILMSITAKIIASMSWEEFERGALGITVYMTLIGLLIGITKLAGGEHADKIGSCILMVSGAMALMALTAKIISDMSLWELYKGIAGVVILGLIAVELVKAVQKVGPDAPKIALTLIAMAVAMGIMAGIAVVLGMIDLASLAKGIGAVAILGSIMSLMIVATRGASDCKANLIVMAVAIGVMAAAVAALSFIDEERLKNAVAALSVLMGMFAIIELASKGARGSYYTLIAMTIALGVLAGILYLLSTFTDVNSLMTTAKALSLLLIAMSGSLLVLTLIGTFIGSALLGIAGLLALCVPMLAFIGIIALMNTVPNAEANAGLLTSFMTTMVLLLTQLAIVGPMALLGVTALTALVALMGVMGGLVVAVAALNEVFPGLKTFVDKGISLLVSLANGLGKIIGAFVGGMAEGVFASLPNLAMSLSLFMAGLMPFILGAKTVDQQALNGVKSLVEMMLLITGASVLDKLTSWIPGGKSLGDFAKELVLFGKDIRKFSDTVTGIDSAAVQAAANAGKMIAEMAATIPNQGGLLADFLGDNKMSVFGTQLPILGEGLMKFSDKVKDLKESAVTAAASAGKMIAEMAATIPNQGGLLADFLGDNKMSVFGTQLPILGDGLMKFSDKVKDFKESDVTAAANAGKVLVELASSIPNSGGWLGKILGENNMDTFGDQLSSFGESLAKFSSSVSGKIDEIATKAASALATDLVKVGEKIGGSILISNPNCFKNFGQDATWLGYYMSQFSDHTKNIDSEKTTAALTLVSELVESAKNISGDVKTFGENLAELGKTGIDKFVDSFSSGESTEKIKTAATKMVNTFIDAVKGKFLTYWDLGVKMVEKIIEGIKIKNLILKGTWLSILSDSITAMRNKYSDFRLTGSYLVEGFIKGIDDNIDKAIEKGRELAKATADASRKELNEHSPSKVGYQIGDYFGVAFVNAIGDYASKAYSAGSDLAAKAKTGLSETISKVSDLLSSDIDSQPTIRPVLDLSDVKSGADELNRMTNGYSLARSIQLAQSSSALMSGNAVSNSFGIADQVKALAQTLAGQSPTSIQNEFNITGDNPQEIANAVAEIIQQQIERRDAVWA